MLRQPSWLITYLDGLRGPKLINFVDQTNDANHYTTPQTGINFSINSSPQNRSSESQTAGLQSLWLASRLKPWLRTTDGLRWLMA